MSVPEQIMKFLPVDDCTTNAPTLLNWFVSSTKPKVMACAEAARSRQRRKRESRRMRPPERELIFGARDCNGNRQSRTYSDNASSQSRIGGRQRMGVHGGRGAARP